MVDIGRALENQIYLPLVIAVLLKFVVLLLVVVSEELKKRDFSDSHISRIESELGCLL